MTSTHKIRGSKRPLDPPDSIEDPKSLSCRMNPAKQLQSNYQLLPDPSTRMIQGSKSKRPLDQPDSMEHPSSLSSRMNPAKKPRSNYQLPDPPDWIKDSTIQPPRWFKKVKPLGTGGFAKVFLVESVSEGGTKFADKVISKTMFAKKNNARLKVMKEIDIHKRMSHDNIVKFCAFFEDQNYMHILLELCPNHTLLHVSKNQKQVPENEVRSYTNQILEGVRYIHRQEVLHRDLKLGNMFLSSDMIVKIGDFGLATTFKENRPGNLCGTPNYIAPEVLDKQAHSVASEVWAIGCMVFALLAGSPPFETSSVTSTYALIKVGNYTLPAGLSNEARDFVQLMLAMNPEERGHISNGPPFNSMSPSLSSHPFMATSRGMPAPNKPGSRKRVIYNPMGMKDPPEILSKARFLDQVVEGIERCLASSVEEVKISLGMVPVFVSKWMDYSNKYGFGYKLTDGRVGVNFKDRSKIGTAVDNMELEFTDQKGKVVTFTRHATIQKPQLKARVDLFAFFERYMEEGLSGHTSESPFSPWSDPGQRTKVPQLVRWNRSEDCVSMELGGGLVQVNHLVDHVKLVLWVHQGKMLVSHVKQDKVQTYHLSGHCPDFIRNRLSDVMQELKCLTNEPIS